MLPFSILLLLTVCILTFVQDHSYERTLSEVSTKLLTSHAQNIKNNLDRFLEQPFNTTLTLADSIQRHQLYQPPRLIKLEDYLKDVITKIYVQQNHINTIAFGSEEKYFVGFRKNNNFDLELLLKDDRTHNQLKFYQGSTSEGAVIHSINNYDPTLRPWYFPFSQSRQAGWSDIYSNADKQQELTITSAAPVFKENELLGVMAIDVNLSRIANFIEHESQAFSGVTYITDSNRQLIATSIYAPIVAQDNSRILASKSSVQVIATSGEHLVPNLQLERPTPSFFEFRENGIRYFSRITPYSNNNLQWNIVISMPEDALLGGLQEQQNLGLITALVLSLLGLILGWYILNMITRPIMDIANASKTLDENNWDVTIQDGIKLHETTQLISAFKSMSSRLQRSFSSLRQQIIYDGLTGLFSRKGLIDHIHAQKIQQRGILILIGLKAFRHTNDSLGHHNGDKLLIAITQRLQQTLHSDVTIARVEKDEFAIFTPHFIDTSHTDRFSTKLLEHFNRPFVIDGMEVMVSACAGVMSGKAEAIDINEWLRNSSLALSQAMQQEQEAVCHYQPYMIEDSQEKTRLTAELKRAIINHEFEVYYQPIINLADDSISGAEALVRWRSPSRGMVSPLQFIPLAEETGMITEIGQQILTQACADTQSQISQGIWPESFTLHVNLSVRELLNTHYVTQLKSILTTTQLPASNLTLEVTESRLISQPLQTTHILEQLRELGIHIAIDDFGTGYSSLGYLTQLPFDSLKIDRSFVSQMLESDSYTTIITAIINMTCDFNADIVAEGVETAEQAQRLKQLGCRYAQGYFYSRPKPLSEWAAMPVTLPTGSTVNYGAGG
ncbi:MAG: diguanylate cyclase (GGDEF)-like protein [Moritella sp.]|jgi:diguanylate cyclase (GGDEF)-like protein